MRRHVIALSPADRIGMAYEMMRLGRIRQLPVVEGVHLAGELAFRDLLAAYRELFGRTAARSAPARRRAWEALEVRPIEALVRRAEDLVRLETPLAEVVRRIARRAVGFVPVVDEPNGSTGLRLIGVVTERDLLRNALACGAAATPPDRPPAA